MAVFITRSRWMRELLVVMGVAVVIGMGEWLGAAGPFRQGLQLISRPLLVKFAWGYYQLGDPVQVVTKRAATVARVEQLESELTQTLARLTELEQVDRENQQLRQNLGAQNQQSRTIIGSPIVSYGLPTISIGSSEGVEVGDPVLAAGAMIGVVETVSEHQSVVSLLSQQLVQPIIVRTESGSEGLVTGDGKRVLLTEVAHDKELHPGERVMTTGQAHVPANLLVGTVGQLISDQSAPVQTAVVEQATNFYEVTIVEVLP
jgi:rod shape-determining protein MreC